MTIDRHRKGVPKYTNLDGLTVEVALTKERPRCRRAIEVLLQTRGQNVEEFVRDYDAGTAGIVLIGNMRKQLRRMLSEHRA